MQPRPLPPHTFVSPSPGHAFGNPRAFTLLEVLAVLLVVLIIAAFAIPNLGRVTAAAQQAICASHMRSIQVGLNGYLQDHGMVWPQGPAPQEPGWASFWLTTLEPYDISPGTWQCPAIRSWQSVGGDQDLALHYVPTTFDTTPNIAHRWTTQPWLIEIADAHGNGPLIGFPDGSVKSYFKVLAEQGVR